MPDQTTPSSGPEPGPEPGPDPGPDPGTESHLPASSGHPDEGGSADSATRDAGTGGPGGTAFGDLLGGGALDMGSLLDTAMQLQEQMASAQQGLVETVVEGQAGGGAVRVEVTGGYQFRAVHITPDAVDPADVEMLEDLVLAALHDASARVNELQSGAMPSLGGLGGLPDLGGFFGGMGDPLEADSWDGDEPDGDEPDGDEPDGDEPDGDEPDREENGEGAGGAAG